MSDARWIEIDRAVASATRNFRQGVDFARHPDFADSNLVGAALQMGCMHAIMAGHTSLENALLRILDLLEEVRPSGESWHADLIGRRVPPANPAARIGGGCRRDTKVPQPRGSLLRHIRSRARWAFHRRCCFLAAALPGTIAQFRSVIDP